MNMHYKSCVIYDNKICDDCGDCNFCDINPDKICDNCGKCLPQYDYNTIEIDGFIIENKVQPSCEEEGGGHNHCDCGHKH